MHHVYWERCYSTAVQLLQELSSQGHVPQRRPSADDYVAMALQRSSVLDDGIEVSLSGIYSARFELSQIYCLFFQVEEAADLYIYE